MKSAKLCSVQKIELTDQPKPQITEPNQVLVRVKALGLCGTDLHIFSQGRADVTYPLVLGHELSGVVEETGADVIGLEPGDKVVLDPVISCGVCDTCKAGHFNVCGEVKCFGVHVDGGLQEYIAVNRSMLYKFPDSLSFEEAALVEPFSVAANVAARGMVGSKDRVIIFGAGTIGLAVLQAVKRLGARVLITDVEDKKLELARKLGADLAVNTRRTALADAITDFSPQGGDVVIDAVGTAPLFEQAIQVAAPFARLVIIAFDSQGASIPPAIITRKELTIVGSRMNCRQFPKVLEWFEEGGVDAKPMISAVYPLDQIEEAFTYTLSHKDENVKTIIQI